MMLFNKPTTPFVWPIQGGLRDDCSILISGTPQGDSRFEVNLSCGSKENDEIAFHFNPRFDTDKVVRNSKVTGKGFGLEELNGPFPFKKYDHFDLVIQVLPTTYRVSVNGEHFCDYNHRIPLNLVSYITIKKGVKVDHVSVYPPSSSDSAEDKMLAPLYNPPMPFKKNIGGLYSGRMIYISGIPKPDAKRFNVNFIAGEDVAFCFDPRFDYMDNQMVLVRNTKIDNKWGQEEREVSNFPFEPGMFFEMVILVTPSYFKVAVNNSHLVDYCHKYQPLDKIDTLSIDEDITLCQVLVQ